MTTNHSMFVSDEEDGDIVLLRYKSQDETQAEKVALKQRLVRWFGGLVTLAWGAAALAPDTFNVPPAFRPWVFVSFIFWFLAACAGVFNL